MTENRRLAIAAPAMEKRMMTLSIVLVLLPFAPGEAVFVVAAMVTSTDDNAMSYWRLTVLLQNSRGKDSLELNHCPLVWVLWVKTSACP
jgi:hypothetical protein